MCSFWIGGGIITKKLLLAVLIVFSTVILYSNSLYAANETQTANATNLTPNQTSNSTSTVSTLPSTGTSTAGDQPRNQTENRTFFNSTTNPSNSPTTSNPSNSPTIPSTLQQYLRETRNSQVNHPAIRSRAASITSGATSTYDRATRIFNWVRNNIRYSFYRNTRRGAVRTLNRRRGNCVDQSHLLIALSRAAGIPARYRHGNTRFIRSGRTFGHVWAQLWVNGRWHDADTTSRRNRFGVINSWDTRRVVMRGTHISLPF